MKTIKEVMDINVADFKFSVRCTNCMKNMGIKTLADLTKYSQEGIAKAQPINQAMPNPMYLLSAIMAGDLKKSKAQIGLSPLYQVKKLN